METPLLDSDGGDQGPTATVRKWGRSVSIMLDHGGTVRRQNATPFARWCRLGTDPTAPGDTQAAFHS